MQIVINNQEAHSLGLDPVELCFEIDQLISNLCEGTIEVKTPESIENAIVYEADFDNTEGMYVAIGLAIGFLRGKGIIANPDDSDDYTYSPITYVSED